MGGLVALLGAPINSGDREVLLTHGWMVEKLGRATDAARVRFTGEFAFAARRELGDGGLSRSAHFKSPAHLVSAVTGASIREANSRLALGIRLRRAEQLGGIPGAESFPIVSAALASAELAVESAVTPGSGSDAQQAGG